MIRRAWTSILIPALLMVAVPPAADAQQKHALRMEHPQRPGRGVPLRPQDRRGPYQEPAFARGYAEGHKSGVDASRGGDRYDPVGERAYRSGDQGYYRDYGSRDAYRNNYRAGFRQGYDDGYRENGRGRR